MAGSSLAEKEQSGQNPINKDRVVQPCIAPSIEEAYLLRWAWSTLGVEGSVIREMLKLTQNPEIISFAGGLPAPETFPTKKTLTELVSRAYDRFPKMMQYGETQDRKSFWESLQSTQQARAMFFLQKIPLNRLW